MLSLPPIPVLELVLICLSKRVSHGRGSLERFEAPTGVTTAAKAARVPQGGAMAVGTWPSSSAALPGRVNQASVILLIRLQA